MIKDPKEQVRELGLFLGKPFEKKEDLEKVVWSYFIKGIVGDWKNYLNPEMEDQINQTTLLKFKDYGLEFKN
ncbi:hypothetical protein H5410_015350 [Solanum commersonii]|uniref:Sulfotransferase n=1 Tax=Solanum commersonii TaxID=4109 RepID=A0A9J5ZTF5_SOLCO|nr:hypothetical protein H5410_015350 [Solanum commersonii]